MTSKSLLLPSLALVLVAAGCTSAEPPRSPSTTSAARTTCPLGVDAAHVVVENTSDGVAFVFSAPPARLEELRGRATDAAAMHGPGAGLGRGHDGRHGGGGQHGLKAMQLPPVRATAEEIPGGARIRLVPVDPADVEPLRERARLRAQSMMDDCH